MAYLGVLPEVSSFGTQVARGLGGGISQGLSQSANFAQQMALEKQKAHSLAGQTKQLEKIKLMETGLGTIDRMKQLISSAGPSNLLQGFFPGETQKNRAELESLGRSLIPLVAAGVPIRNQKEFDEYRKIITNPNAQQSQLEGALSGIENILRRSIESPDDAQESQKKTSKSFKSGSSEMVNVQAPDGTVRKIPKSHVKSAMEAGGKVVR